MPRGVTSPMPVTTTRLMASLPGTRNAAARRARIPQSRSAVRLDKAHGVLDRDDLLGGIVGDLAPELLLERHDQLDRVEAVGAEIVDEAGVFGNLCFLDAQMLDDDLLDPLGDVTHPIFPVIA